MREENIREQDTKKDEKMPHSRTPLTYKIECLARAGYTNDFQMCEEGLKCLNTGDVFQPGDLHITEHQRFEGITNPEDMAILYVVETNSGLKGTIVDAFGIYADADLMGFMKQVEDRTVQNIDQSCGC